MKRTLLTPEIWLIQERHCVARTGEAATVRCPWAQSLSFCSFGDNGAGVGMLSKNPDCCSLVCLAALQRGPNSATNRKPPAAGHTPHGPSDDRSDSTVRQAARLQPPRPQASRSLPLAGGDQGRGGGAEKQRAGGPKW